MCAVLEQNVIVQDFETWVWGHDVACYLGINLNKKVEKQKKQKFTPLKNVNPSSKYTNRIASQFFKSETMQSF